MTAASIEFVPWDLKGRKEGRKEERRSTRKEEPEMVGVLVLTPTREIRK